MAAARRPGPLSRASRRAGDVGVICELIRGLARYERLEGQCVIQPAAVRRHGFGRGVRYFETLICRRRGRPIGFALYFFTYSTFLGQPTLYLEDLFVVPAERGRGAGRACCERSRASPCAAAADGWNGRCRLEHAPIRFYKRLARMRKEDSHATHRRAAASAARCRRASRCRVRGLKNRAAQEAGCAQERAKKSVKSTKAGNRTTHGERSPERLRRGWRRRKYTATPSRASAGPVPVPRLVAGLVLGLALLAVRCGRQPRGWAGVTFNRLNGGP